MSTADDWAAVERAVQDYSIRDGSYVAVAFERIKACYKVYLDAASRVPDLANKKWEEDEPIPLLEARDLRRLLGDAYLGGPIP